MQRCIFCQAEFEEIAEQCPACGQRSSAADPETPQLLERSSPAARLKASASAEGAVADETSSPGVPGVEQKGFDAHDLPISADGMPPVPGEEPDLQRSVSPLAFDGEPASQGGQSPPQDQEPALAALPSEVTGARSTKPWHKSYAKALVVILAVLVVLAGSGAAFYFLTLPQPVLSVSGPSQVGSTPAGSPDQFFHVSGQRFAANSAITFLLDGSPAPGAPQVTSKGNGTFTVALPITDDWLVGKHALTAKDSQGDTTASEAPVVIVQQGDAGTPGPNSAPANDASFSIVLSGFFITSPPGTGDITPDQLIVTGRPDPAGGRVCSGNDDGQPHTVQLQNQDGSEFERDTTTYGCSGTYKYGHLTYTETVIHIVFEFLSGDLSGTTCTGGGYIYSQLEGTFSDATTISGTARYPEPPPIPCNKGGPITIINQGPQGTMWTGTLETTQHESEKKEGS